MVAGVDEVSERVKSLIAQVTGRERAVITLETQLDRDLGCTPDEVHALLARVQREFGVDMTGFDYDRHFDPPGSLVWPLVVAAVVALPMTVLAMYLLAPVFRASGLDGARIAASGGLFWMTYVACMALIGIATTLLPFLRSRGDEKVPLTVEMLIEAAILKRWPAARAEGMTS